MQEANQVRYSSKLEVRFDALKRQPLFSIRILTNPWTLKLRGHPAADLRGGALKSGVLLNDLFVELRHMYYDFGGVEFLEDGMCLILEEMDEGTRDEVMRDLRAIYGKDDSVLKSFMYEPVEEYL